MTCASCANRIERKLNKLDGVTATVNYATERATVDYDADGGRAGAAGRRRRGGRLLRRRCREPRARRGREDETAPLRRRLLVSLALTLPVLLMSMIPRAAVRELAVAVADARRAGRRVGRAGRSTAPRGRTCATRPRRWTRSISVGVLAAFGWSLYALFLGDAGMPGMRMAFDLLPERGAGADEIYLEVASGGDRVHPRRPLLRGARQAPRRRRADRAARARRQGRRDARRATARSAACRSSSSRSATASSCARARRSPPTASSSPAPPPSTSRC